MTEYTVKSLEAEEPQFRETTASSSNSDYKNLGRVIQISFSFLLLFSAFNTCQNLASTVLSDDGLGSFGFYTLATMFFVLIFVAFIATAIDKKIGMYRLLVIGSFFHFTLILAFILPAYKSDHPDDESWLVSTTTIETLLLVTAALNGFGSAVLWVSCGNYISLAATSKSRGMYFGLFWVFYMGSQTTGSLIGAFILNSGFK